MPTLPQICPGTCNNAYRRAEEALATLGVEHHLTPSWGSPVQCEECVERTRKQLQELPALLTDALNEALEGTAPKLTGTIGRVGLTPAWPGQASRLLVDRIVSEMAELHADVLKLRGLWQEDREPLPSVAANERRHIAGITRVLAAHWGWAMQHHPAASEPHTRGNANPAAQASSWYRTVLHFTKQDDQRETRRLAPCPRCRGPWLVESRDMRLVDGEPYIACQDPDCQRVMTKSEYDDYVKAMRVAIERAA